MTRWQWALVVLFVPFGSLLLIAHLVERRRWNRTFSDRVPRLRRLLKSVT